MSDLGRVPPHSEEAEQAVLGAILQDDGCLPFVRSIVGPEHVYVEAHRAIFEAMVELSAAGTRIDAVTLADRLRARGQYDRVGGAAYLDRLIDVVPVSSHVEEQAAIVRRDAALRAAALLAARVTAAVHEPGADPAVISGMLSRGSAEILPRQPTRRPGDILRAQVAAEPGRQVRFHLVGTDGAGQPVDLGGMLGWFSPGQKILIGARTSVGKTALLRMFWLASAAAGTPAAYLSFEDSDEEIVGGAAGAVSWLTTRPILAHRWSSRAKAEAERIAAWMDRLPLSVAYLSTPTIEEAVTAIRWQVAHEHARVIVVDYLQKIRGGDGREGRVSYIGRALAEMSRACRDEAVLVVGSQLRRAPPGSAKDRAPSRDDFRDSGEIEEDAKAAILLRSVGEDDRDAGGTPHKRHIVMDLTKNKLGPTGEIPATLWLRHTSLWPGARRPTFDLSAGTITPPDDPVVEDEHEEPQAPDWVQQELGAGEDAAFGEEGPF